MPTTDKMTSQSEASPPRRYITFRHSLHFPIQVPLSPILPLSVNRLSDHQSGRLPLSQILTLSVNCVSDQQSGRLPYQQTSGCN
ncbi:hypothetical protein J6590_015518 [Homalodisca vitripennis]|nr:hypothetical protein J6590_015518 [Homalodisca vitripennis]